MVAGTPPSKLPLYEASTQFKHWRYSQDQLAHVRSSLNLAAVAVIRRNFETNEVCSSSQHFPSCSFRLLAGFFHRSLVPNTGRRTASRQTLHNKDRPAMWSLWFSGRGGSNLDHLSETLLPQKYCDGLASKKRHVCMRYLFI